ncbi:hypothetical protein HH308_18115 [Gordonia sp. TBRC 11910]|uniref:Uncharacterized protein n=1 Tax=Gordonia asplenii TaxID=2725283 RepID=A0A848L3H8_9ACTN|nr:hypothetical protein [Gordonia asplenii]NMO03131.1 hypothetical protein [Gordonia asplenii]
MKVVVSRGFQVAHDGTVFGSGEVADVPDDVADAWIRSGWADAMSRRPRPKAHTEAD